MSRKRQSRPGANETAPIERLDQVERQLTAADRHAEHECDWRAAVAAMSEFDRAPYDEPHIYADLHW